MKRKQWIVLAIVLMVVGCAAAGQNAFGSHIENMDTNGNGLISEEEWHAAMQKRFESIDKNGDGNLSRDEIDETKATMRDRIRSRRGIQP